MTRDVTPDTSSEKFGPWLRREFLRALKIGSGLLIVTLALTAGLAKISPSFAAAWTQFNYQLSAVALHQHPVGLARTLATRLADHEYGLSPVFSTSPFNITAARVALQADFPEVASINEGVPRVPRAAALREANPERYEQRLAEFTRRHQALEQSRFARLYDRDDVFTAPNANTQLGIVATKVLGLPDAALHTIHTIIIGGPASIAMVTTVLVISAAALWRSRRPARTWLKFLMWPTLASALVWGAILIMAIAAALFSSLTPNTSALALIASIPLLLLLAKAPLHLAANLVHTPPKWDGVERRKNRAPATPAQ